MGFTLLPIISLCSFMLKPLHFAVRIPSIELNNQINSKEFDETFLALSKSLNWDMREFFESDFGKNYCTKWLEEHVQPKTTYALDDYDDEEE